MNIGKAAKKILGIMAPTLGTALGGPLGGMAGKFLADGLGVKPEELDTALANPENQVKLRELDVGFKTRLRELDIDEKELDVRNTESARQMAMKNMWPQILLSCVFIVGYFIVLNYILTEMSVLDESIKVLVASLLGLFTREIPTIMQFWFGSSSGSKSKTDKLSSI